MKLEGTLLRYLSKESFRVLTAVEIGMKNHEIVPEQLISSISGLKRGTHKILQDLLKNKLISHQSKPYQGFTPTYRGYDYLALHYFVSTNVLTQLGN